MNAFVLNQDVDGEAKRSTFSLFQLTVRNHVWSI
jgi:hypothetical protein